MMSLANRPSLLLIPGFLCNASVWAPQVAALSENCELHIADLRGHDSFGSMAEAAIAQMEGQFCVVGHSMGAKVGLEVIRQVPGRVSRSVLMNTSVHPPGEKEAADRQRLLEQAWQKGMASVATDLASLMLHPEHARDQALLATVRAMMEGHSAGELAQQIRASLSRPDQQSLLSQIQHPVLLVASDADQWASIAQHETMKAELPDARLEVLAHCGHMSTLEAADRVTTLIREWCIDAQGSG